MKVWAMMTAGISGLLLVITGAVVAILYIAEALPWWAGVPLDILVFSGVCAGLIGGLIWLMDEYDF